MIKKCKNLIKKKTQPISWRKNALFRKLNDLKAAQAGGHFRINGKKEIVHGFEALKDFASFFMRAIKKDLQIKKARLLANQACAQLDAKKCSEETKKALMLAFAIAEAYELALDLPEETDDD